MDNGMAYASDRREESRGGIASRYEAVSGYLEREREEEGIPGRALNFCIKQDVRNALGRSSRCQGEFTAGDRKSREDAFIRADFICLRPPKVRRKGTSCCRREARRNYAQPARIARQSWRNLIDNPRGHRRDF